MKKILLSIALLFAFASNSIADSRSPIIYGNGCAYNLLTQACIGGGGGGVTSVFGRTGVVTAQAGDYAAFYLALTGGTLSGELTLNPTAQVGLNDAATIGMLNGALTGYLPLAGGVNMTGLFNLSGDAVTGNQPVTFSQFQAGISGLSWKNSVQCITAQTASPDVSSLPPYTYSNGSSGVGATITEIGNGAFTSAMCDTVSSVTLGMRILLPFEISGNVPYNGIYTVTQIGDGSNPFIFTRSTDDDTMAQMNSATVQVSGGSFHQNHILTQTTHNPVIGIDPINWIHIFEGLQSADGVTLQLIGNVYSIKNGGVSDAQVNAAAAIAGTKISPNFGSQNVVTTGTGSFSDLLITGTAGNGYINLLDQSSSPSMPISSLNLFADNSGNFNLQTAAGILSILNLSASTNRTYTLPDATGTVTLNTATQTLTNKTLTSSTDILGAVTMTLGSDATGDIYYRNSGGLLTRLGIGAAGTVVTSSGTIPSWAPPAPLSSINATSLTYSDFITAIPVANNVFLPTGGSGNGAITYINSTTALGSRPGIVGINSGTAPPDRYGLGSISNIVLGNNIATYTYEESVLIPTLSNGVNNFTALFGFGTNYSISSSSVIAFEYNQDTISSSCTTNAIVNPTQLTLCTNLFTTTHNIAVGASVSGIGIQAGSVVVSVNGSTVTMSLPATASNAGDAITFVNSGTFKTHVNLSNATFDTGITAVANTWYKLTIVINSAGNTATFYINGVQVNASAITGSGGSFFLAQMVYDTLGTGGSVYVDYMSLLTQMVTPR